METERTHNAPKVTCYKVYSQPFIIFYFPIWHLHLFVPLCRNNVIFCKRLLKKIVTNYYSFTLHQMKWDIWLGSAGSIPAGESLLDFVFRNFIYRRKSPPSSFFSLFNIEHQHTSYIPLILLAYKFTTFIGDGVQLVPYIPVRTLFYCVRICDITHSA